MITENPSKCGRCGSLNPGGMKFCGMCGASLEPTAEPPGVAPPSSPPRAAPVTEAARARPAASPGPAPAHTGGMFRLGGHDDHAPRSLDYLLEDDEPKSGPGSWVVGIVLALALAGGLGYWHYRNGGWSPTGKPATPSATVEAPAGTNAGDSSIHPSDAAGGAATTPAATATSAGDASAAATPQAAPPGALTEVRPNNPAGAAPATTAEAPAKDNAPAPAHPGRNTKPSPDAEVAAAAPKPRATRPEAPIKADDPVTQGEKYIYGRGLPQNCERGLKMVKPAADQSNSKAMITMGALYATGHCVNRDLPTAYRYFALALRKDPENGALKQNAEMVWGQMTQSERQQAIRLTQ